MTQRSKIFYTDACRKIEKEVENFLVLFINEHVSLSPEISDSPRAVGDAIENILVENFGEIIGGLSKEYSSQFARRAMADFAFLDEDDFYHVIDVKTHRLDTEFNMPNLTSVKRLSRFYEDDKNYFVVLKVNYKVEDSKVIVDKVIFTPIEFFLGLLDHWGFGLGANPDSKCKYCNSSAGE